MSSQTIDLHSNIKNVSKKIQFFANSESSKNSYIPALDGLRALSIIMVVFFHDIGPYTSNYGHWLNGWVGVDVFFIISGFLITSILLKEKAKNKDDFSLTKFYTRRFLRIAPVYYLFILVAMAWSILGANHHIKPFICAAFYLSNLDLAFSWNLIPLKLNISHLWSLAVEEQFYLFWPSCLKLLKKNALSLVIALIAGVYFWRIFLILHGANWIRIYHSIDTRMDSLMFGVIIAYLSKNEKYKLFFQKYFAHNIIQISILTFLILSFHYLGHPGDGNISDQLNFWGLKLPLSLLLTSTLIISVITAPQACISRLFTLTPLTWLGKLSYSLYLWHPLVHQVYCSFHWSYVCRKPMAAEAYQYLLIVLVAAISYYVIEKPFLKLKERFS